MNIFYYIKIAVCGFNYSGEPTTAPIPTKLWTEYFFKGAMSPRSTHACRFIVVPCKNTKQSWFIDFTEYATFSPSHNTTMEVVTKECERETFPIKTCERCKEMFRSSGIIEAVKKDGWNMLHSSQYDMATIVSIYTLVKKPLHSPVKDTRAFSNHVQAQSLASMLCIF